MTSRHEALRAAVRPRALVCLEALRNVHFSRGGRDYWFSLAREDKDADRQARILATLAKLGYQMSGSLGIEKPVVLLHATHVVKMGLEVQWEARLSYAASRGRMIATTADLLDCVIVQERAHTLASKLQTSDKWRGRCYAFELRCIRFGLNDTHSDNYGLFADGFLKLFDPAAWNARSILSKWENRGSKTRARLPD